MNLSIYIQLHFIFIHPHKHLQHIQLRMNIKLKNQLTNLGSSSRTRPLWVMSCDVLYNNQLIALICATSKLLSRLS